ncbi:ECERIFERUM 2-like protein [Drosera capensis]
MPTPSAPSSHTNDLIYDRKITSVVPAKVTGEGRVHPLSPLDMSYKSNNVKGLYVFENTGLQAGDFKVPMFEWLVHFVVVCGRIRVAEETGEVVIKMNDAGIRMIEAKARVSVEEWLEMEGRRGCEDHGLVPERGEAGDAGDLSFSPMVLLQMTWFKCGGLALGLNWAHMLGDIFSASAFMNVLGHFLQGQYPTKPLQIPKPTKLGIANPTIRSYANSTKLRSYSLHISKQKLDDIRSTLICSKNVKVGKVEPFELITVLIWKTIATIRNKAMEPRAVTICKNGLGDGHNREKMIPYNGLDITTIQVDFSVTEVDVSRLVSVIVEQTIEENNAIDLNGEEKERGSHVYGERLTFLDLDGANVYGFKMKGKCPRYVKYSLDGVGDGGVVLVIPGSKSSNETWDSKLVTVILPEHELEELKTLLKTRWDIQ